MRPPFGLEHEGAYDRVEAGPLVAALAADHRVAALLVRLGGYAVGVFEGEQLVASKVGSRLVHGRHRAGGSSAQPLPPPPREGGARAAREGGAGGVARARPVARSASSGRRWAATARRCAARSTADARLAPLEAIALPRFFTVPDPRRDVLERLPFDLYAAELEVEPLGA